jgi:hypothetical protein
LKVPELEVVMAGVVVAGAGVVEGDDAQAASDTTSNVKTISTADRVYLPVRNSFCFISGLLDKSIRIIIFFYDHTGRASEHIP